MPNREVNLTKRVQTPRGVRYCPVVLSANGQVKPDVVRVNGHEERHAEDAYYLEWRENGKRVRLSLARMQPRLTYADQARFLKRIYCIGLETESKLTPASSARERVDYSPVV